MSSSTLANIANLYNPKKKRWENYLKRAAQMGLNSTDMKSLAHLRSNLARDRVFSKPMQNMVLLQCILKMGDIMPNKSHSSVAHEILRDIGCGIYVKDRNNNYEYNYEYLYSNIQSYISKRQIIFIMIGMEEYCLIEGINDNFYATHSTCLVLIPRKDKYDAYYINSHGRDMGDTKQYVRRVTRKRTKTISFNIPSELVFIRDLIGYWNTLVDFNKNKINIDWDMSPRHTYFSTDLQAGDYHGACFIFPQVLWHHMGEFYTQKKELCEDWGRIEIDSGENLLKNGQLSIFVKYAFLDFGKNYKETFIRNIDTVYKMSIDDPLQKTISERRIAFIKCILCSLVRYMNQI